ncbi:DUF2922 domain-containing protein [Peribacillus deserti]|uniref:DUF2922 domain-containing protein n=1 Tax=Peribacillus deserti TaxID=673318 RepID=A0A2N5M2N6_9BACI|nr:DUF2922 domain-containing protein [Peribacillus deserti]PLT28585.1 DUF2922 domain-containing protein [Peribacillus deserti]
MAKTLELVFITADGKNSKISVEDPKEPVDVAAVKQAMDSILAANIFMTSSGDLTAKKNARIIDRTVQEYELI